MDADTILKDASAAMDKAIGHTLHEFSGLHTGKASPAMVENLPVAPASYGGSSMPLHNLAAVSTPDARTIQITPWDKGVTSDIEKAIQQANIGLNPRNDGGIIRVSVPELTGDRRRELVKTAHGLAEQGRVGVRQVRRDAMEQLKKLQKDGHVSEDDIKRYEKDVQSATDKHIEKIDESLAAKEKELTTV